MSTHCNTQWRDWRRNTRPGPTPDQPFPFFFTPYDEAAMDLRKIKKLIDLLEESNLAEIEIKEGEESVRLARMPRGMTMSAPAPVQMQAAHAEAPRATAPAPAAHASSSESHGGKGGGKDVPDGHMIRSPMVGT